MFTRTFHPIRHALVCAALAAGVSVYAPLASAADALSAQRVIEYHERDLADEAGAAKLYDRLQAASRTVCRALVGRELSRVRLYEECYSKALADAVADVNQQTLTALHARDDSKSARVTRTRVSKAAS
jgi:UrcA family protein